MVSHLPLQHFAAVSGGPIVKSLLPIINVLSGIAGLVAVAFLVVGGIGIMTSAGKPDKLEHAKHTIRNALIGLVLVLGAVTLANVLGNSFTRPTASTSSDLPVIVAPGDEVPTGSLVDVLSGAIAGMLKGIIQGIGQPLIEGLSHFTNATPLMTSNPTILTIWLAITGIADGLFIIVIILLGLHKMSATSLGLDEIETKQIIPQLVIIFLLLNTSIFIIDGIIQISNLMIQAFHASLINTDVWTVLGSVINKGSGLSLAALLILAAFLIIAVILIIYYIMRLVALYIGAVLSPLVLLLWLLPAFRDFSAIIMRTYLVTVFVLFIHVVILQIAASLLAGLNSPSASAVLISMFVGIAALLTILKTQSVLSHVSFISLGVRNTKQLGRKFVSSTSTLANQFNAGRTGSAVKAGAAGGSLPQVIQYRKAPNVTIAVQKADKS